MIKPITSFLFFFICFGVSAQNFSAKIIDKNTTEPVPFAAIQTATYRGVISNEEGVFSIDLENHTLKTITISCLGYETLTLGLEQIINDDFVVKLEPSINELNTIYLSTTRPNADSIIAKTIRRLVQNHSTDDISRFELFHRETSSMDFEKLDFEISKASHVRKKQLTGVNNELDSLTREIKTSNLVHFTDFKGALSTSNKLGYKFEAEKATQIINSKKDFSIDNIQGKAQNIILKYLDTTLTYKLKTGLFKIEDSLSLADNDHDKNDKQEFTVDDLKSKAYKMYTNSSVNSKSLLKSILNLDYYKYTLRDISNNDNNLVYVIDYSPRKAKSKYSGTLFIEDDSYAVLKTSYKYAKGKRGEKLNLRLILGVKYVENVKNGLLLFRKNSNNIYEPRYIKEETGRYFYINRPLKFIENSRDRRKVSFKFKIEGTIKHKEELLFTDSKTLAYDDFMAIKELETISYQKQRKYDANVWGNSETLVPTKELKTFDATEN